MELEVQEPVRFSKEFTGKFTTFKIFPYIIPKKNIPQPKPGQGISFIRWNDLNNVYFFHGKCDFTPK
jgi:hypothetical protein